MLDTNLVVRKSISGKLFILSLIRVFIFVRIAAKLVPQVGVGVGGSGWTY